MTKTEMDSRFIKLAGAVAMRGPGCAPFSPVLSREALVRRLRRGSACLTELGLEQRCPRCGEFWPWDSEFFGLTGQQGKLQSWCRSCMNEMYRIRRARRKEPHHGA
ncbi:hypothetical protein [Aeromonas diversa]|uniref:hypothetical protein n=1 Tax=Aeromonas diversa TaxID=502790 RepID=UPI003462C621